MGHLATGRGDRITFASALRWHPERWSLPTLAVALSVGGRRTMHAWVAAADKLDRALLAVSVGVRRSGPVSARARINRMIAKS